MELVDSYRRHWRVVLTEPVTAASGTKEEVIGLRLEVKGTTKLLICRTRAQAGICPTILILLQTEQLNRVLEVTIK